MNQYNELAPIYFVGLAGVGMSALAQFMAMQGLEVSGSDRQFDQADKPSIQKQLEALKIHCAPQDGSFLTSHIKTMVVSSAIEDTNPDIVQAKKLGIQVIHRSELLGKITDSHRTIAISGTSGKSTTTAMIFEMLSAVGIDPSLITGAGLHSLAQKGYIGNAWVGKSDLLVVEADESDGTLVRYHPEIGVILNIDKDHKDIEELKTLFLTFRSHSQKMIVNAGHPLSARLSQNQVYDFGNDKNCGFFGANYKQEDWSCTFDVNGVQVQLPAPGKHNMENALAAIAVGKMLGLNEVDLARGLADYQGIHRRHTYLGTFNGVDLIDDYAHNPAKVAAAIQACQIENKRVVAWFQPHGFGPTRFLRNDFVNEIAQIMRPQDQIYFSEIYYAGGTVVRDISAGDLIQDLQQKGVAAHFIPNRLDFKAQINTLVQSGDVLLLMGARDPSLESFAVSVQDSLTEAL